MLPPLAVVFVLATLSVLAFPAEAHTFRASSAPRVQSSYTLTATPSQVAPGAQLNVSWTAPSGRPSTDWIALYKVGDPNTTYGSWQYTQGATSGTFTVTTPTTAAKYEFRYLLQNGFTVVASSNIVPVTVAPAVSITAPANNTSFVSPAAVTINATASDSDGSVSKVEFFQGSTKLGETTTSPYSYTWSNVGAGSYVLTAKATDNLGAVMTSTAVNITVNLPTGVISGKVTRTDGTTQIAGATVKVYQGTALKGMADTNATGDYTVGALNTGTYTVQASAAGYESATQTGISVTNGVTTTLNLSLPVPINYVYDELGRLVSVIDKDGNAATYAYDSVGNLLSISRQVPTQVSIIQFSPSSGPVGASVTVYGAGFSATASQNSVAFNGVSATVISSSTNLIVTTVPASATTGAIAVTSPTGSATSAASFSVSAGTAGMPTITGFSPAVGAAGTAVTITGTNFDANPSNEKVALNATLTSPTSGTSTSVATSVPSAAGSGRISVSTPYGKVISSADFIVPPSPYTAANIEYTGRMSIGESKTVTITTAGKVALVLFDGIAGQRVSVKGTNCTISTGSANIYNPDRTALIAPGSFILGYLFYEPQQLFRTGTYTIVIAPDNNYTGSITLTLYDVPPDLTSTIAIGGAPVSVTITTPGQNAVITFNAAAGQRVSLSANSSNIASWVVSLIKPDGLTLASMSGVFIDNTALPTAGVYTILVNPAAEYIGTATLTLYNVADVTGSLTIGAPPVSTSIIYPGQRSKLTFSGSAGQRVSLLGSNNTMGEGTLSIQNPDGTTLTSMGGLMGSSPFLDTKTLAATGTYTVVVDPINTQLGGMSIRLYDVVDAAGPIVPGGSPVTVTTTIPGQNASLTFSGSAGQRISLSQTNVFFWGTTIIKPDGTTLVSSSAVYIDLQTLPTTGTYTLKIDPSDALTGSRTLTLYDVPPDITGTVTIGGASVGVTTTVPGQNGLLTFAGTAGQVVTIHLTNNAIGIITLKLLKPDGSQLSSSYNSGNFNLSNQTLPTSGTYSIVIDPLAGNIGSLSISVTSP